MGVLGHLDSVGDVSSIPVTPTAATSFPNATINPSSPYLSRRDSSASAVDGHGSSYRQSPATTPTLADGSDIITTTTTTTDHLLSQAPTSSSSSSRPQTPSFLDLNSTTATTNHSKTTAAAMAASSSSTLATSTRDTPHSPQYIALVLFFFASSSLGAVFVNKACLTHYDFSHPFVLMLGQAISAVVAMSALARSRPDILTITPVKRSDYRRLLLPTALFVANVSVGLSALTRVNIPMFSAFRRLTVLFVMLAEYVLLRRTHSRRVMASVFLLAFGAFVSGVGDVTFSRTGYMLVFLNNILTASYLAVIKRVMRDLSLEPLSLLYYTALLAILPVAVICHLTGDLHAAVEAYSTRPDLQNSVFFIPSLVAVAASAFCVNLSTSVCTHVTSPLTTSVVGQVKNVLQTLLGFFSWGYVPTPMNLFGLTVALFGQLLFGYFKFVESNPDVNLSRQSWMRTLSKHRKAGSVHDPDSDRSEEDREPFIMNGASSGMTKRNES